MPSTFGTLIAETIRDQRRTAHMHQIEQTLGRIEVHIRALAAAAAQAQMAMQSIESGRPGWSERYDTLAHNLAEPALDELAALRVVLKESGIPDANELP